MWKVIELISAEHSAQLFCASSLINYLFDLTPTMFQLGMSVLLLIINLYLRIAESVKDNSNYAQTQLYTLLNDNMVSLLIIRN